MFEQKIVGIAGRQGVLRFEWSDDKGKRPVIEPPIAEASRHLRFEQAPCRWDGRIAEIAFDALCAGRGTVRIRIHSPDGEDVEETELPYAVFPEKALFVNLVISSNHHVGFNPGLNTEDDLLEEVQGSGDGYANAKTHLEAVFHKYGAPITWLIDGNVSVKALADLRKWSLRYGDDVGLMPTSLFFHNAVDYNRHKSADETLSFIRSELDRLEQSWKRKVSIAGIDQFVGSVGEHFVEAARTLGLQGLWGVGYDHFLCDTSMFHRGVPWEAYKPQPSRFRNPSRLPTRLWMFQWTQRDVLLTSRTPTGYSGSVIFSTDPDDIRTTGILRAQEDYYNRLLEQYTRNLDFNDFVVFTVHQEDHDVLFGENNLYLESFLDRIGSELPVTFATLEEVALWLNLKYAPESHPSAVMRFSDVLTCHDSVVFNRGGVRQPADWPQDPNGYPDHLAYYDRSLQTLTCYPDPLPFRIYVYGDDEAGESADGQTKEMTDHGVKASMHVREDGIMLLFLTPQPFESMTYVLWQLPDEDYDFDRTQGSEGAVLSRTVTADGGVYVLRLRLTEGYSSLFIPKMT